MQLTDLPAKIKIPVAIRILEKYGKDIFKCPCCASGRLQIVSSHRYFKSQAQEYRDIRKLQDARNKAAPVETE